MNLKLKGGSWNAWQVYIKISLHNNKIIKWVLILTSFLISLIFISFINSMASKKRNKASNQSKITEYVESDKNNSALSKE